jgi:asparagine synthase (glutamine-hydrolysing)
MASKLAPGVLEDLATNAQRGLWYVEFDPAGGMSDTKGPAGSGAASTGGRNGTSRLGVHLMGAPDVAHPTWARRGSVEVVFAGNLLNRDELVRQGDRPSRRRSDADLVLDVYRHRGSDFLLDLRGFFCVIVSDADQDLLLAARDHLGVSSLFMSELPRKLVLSPVTVALLRHPSVPATLNRSHLVDQLRHAYPDAGETYFAAIRRIMPGHLLRWEGGRVEVGRYWDPLPSDKPIEWLTEDEVERFGSLFEQAVTRCLRIGPAGIFLSGGLDSVSVAAMAADISGRLGLPTPLALSLGFSHPTVDERETQRGVARGLGLPIFLLQLEEAVGDRGLLLTDLEMCRTWPAPLLNPWLPGYCRLGMEAIEQGRQVILTGGGGDEWLTVGPNYAADMFRAGNFRGLKFVWNMWKNTYQLSNRALVGSLVKYGFLPPTKLAAKRIASVVAPRGIASWKRWRSIRSMPEWLAPDPALRQTAIGRDGAKADEEQLFPDEPLSYYLTDGRHAVDHVGISMETEEDYEVGRRFGFKEADPYWDPDLASFLYRTPPEQLLRGGRGKGLVRWMLSERFPDLGFESQKKMVSLNFFQQTMLRDVPRGWAATGGVQALSALGVVDGGRFEATARSIVRNRQYGKVYRVWDVLTTEAWVQGRS